MKYSSVFLLLSIFCINPILAQYSITGQITDTVGATLDFANVLVLSAADSTFIDGTTTEEEGSFAIELSNAGTFILSVSILGFDSFTSDQFALSDNNPNQLFPAIVLTASGIKLETINVTAEKPFFEQRIDRTIVNVANTITATGLSALEILERSPGVLVNRQGDISMMGKSGVNIMINGRLNYMPQNALLDFLAGISAENILSIELITTPPADLDAEGNAGYINIVLKNNPNDGFNGNYSVAAGYGRGTLANSNLSFNFRKKKVNLFGAYGYSYNARPQFSDQTRRTGLDADFSEDYLSKDRNPIRNNQNGRLGLDYQINNRTTVGFLLSGYINIWDMEEESFIKFSPSAALDTLITSLNVEKNIWKHLQTNVNFNHRFASGNLNIDFDYLLYDNENPTTYDQDFMLEDGVFLKSEDLFSNTSAPFNIVVGSADYSNSFLKKGNIKTGVKAVISTFENEVDARINGNILPQYTDKSDLSEQVLAVYAQTDFPLSDKISTKAGLRYEYSDTKLISEVEGKTVDRAFGNFFPSLFLQYKVDETTQFNLSYSRRINRPSFSNMASFVIFLDPRTLFGGNARLQPAISNTFKAGYRFKTINLSLEYSQEDSTIVLFQNRYNPATKVTTIIPDNLEKQRIFNASIAFPLKVTNWWRMRLFGQPSFKEAVTQEEDISYTIKQGNFFVNGNQTFTLPKDYTIELSGFFRTGNVNGNAIVKSMNVLNLGLQKKLKNNARLSINVSDVLNSLRSQVSVEIPAKNFFIQRQFDFSQRTFTISYSSSFGNSKIKAARNRESGSEEKKRVN